MKEENILGTQKISVLLRKFATPSVIALIISAFYNIVDQFFIGHSVGVLGNAATNVAFPLVTVSLSIALLIGIGSASNFNLNMGRKREDVAKKFVGNAFTLMIIMGLILTIIVKLFLDSILKAFGTTDQIMDLAKSYTRITSYGFIFLILSNAGTALIRADGSPRYSMNTIVVGCVLNIILDPIFIFVFDWGIAGAAWATVIGQVVSGIMVLVYARNFKTVDVNKEDFKPEPYYIRQMVSLGLAPFFNQFALIFVQLVTNNIVVYYGSQSPYGSEIPLAVVGIAFKVYMIFFSIAIGISQGAQPLFSYNYGAEKYERVKETYKLAVTNAIKFLFVAFLIFEIFPTQVLGLFGTGSDEYFQFGKLFFRIFFIMTALNPIQPISANFLSSIGKPKKGAFISLTRQILFFIPLAIILPIFLGINGLLISGPIADFAAFIASIILVKTQFKEMDKLISKVEA